MLRMETYWDFASTVIASIENISIRVANMFGGEDHDPIEERKPSDFNPMLSAAGQVDPRKHELAKHAADRLSMVMCLPGGVSEKLAMLDAMAE